MRNSPNIFNHKPSRAQKQVYIRFLLYRGARKIGDGLICERCSSQVYMVEKCNSCGKMVCQSCVKSAKRLKKVSRVVICRDCWGDMKKRSKFKAL